MKYLRIDVYKYPNGIYLGTRHAPYREFRDGEKLISNSVEINSQVEEVKKLHNEKEIFFKTTII